MGNISSLQYILIDQAKEKKIKSTAEIFRTSGPFLLQKGCYNHENLLHNGNSWCANTATPLEHPRGIHMQDSRAVASQALSLPFHPSSAGQLLPLEVGKR